MAKFTETDLRQQIKSASFSNAYLIYGEEGYLKEHYISQLKKKIIDPAFESFNLHQFDGKDTEMDDILKDAQILPMMSEYNLVIVRDYPVEKTKSDIKLMEEFLPATVLYSLWSIRFLYKFDLQTSTLLDLRKWVIAYKRRIRGELYCTPFIALGLFVSVFIIHHHYRSVQLMIFDGIMFLVGALATYLGYMYWDKRSIAEIESGLKELQDFESGE